MALDKLYRVRNTEPGKPLCLEAGRWDGLTFRKELIYCGDFVKRNQTTHQKFSIDPIKLEHWEQTGNLMISNGVDVPLPLKHNDSPEAGRGKVVRYETGLNSRGIPALYGIVRFRDKEAAKMARSTNVSIYVPEPPVYDGLGNEYKYPIRHVALTDYPVIPKLEGFEAIAASFDELVLGGPGSGPRSGQKRGPYNTVDRAVGGYAARKANQAGKAVSRAGRKALVSKPAREVYKGEALNFISKRVRGDDENKRLASHGTIFAGKHSVRQTNNAIKEFLGSRRIASRLSKLNPSKTPRKFVRISNALARVKSKGAMSAKLAGIATLSTALGLKTLFTPKRSKALSLGLASGAGKLVKEFASDKSVRTYGALAGGQKVGEKAKSRKRHVAAAGLLGTSAALGAHELKTSSLRKLGKVGIKGIRKRGLSKGIGATMRNYSRGAKPVGMLRNAARKLGTVNRRVAIPLVIGAVAADSVYHGVKGAAKHINKARKLSFDDLRNLELGGPGSGPNEGEKRGPYKHGKGIKYAAGAGAIATGTRVAFKHLKKGKVRTAVGVAGALGTGAMLYKYAQHEANDDLNTFKRIVTRAKNLFSRKRKPKELSLQVIDDQGNIHGAGGRFVAKPNSQRSRKEMRRHLHSIKPKAGSANYFQDKSDEDVRDNATASANQALKHGTIAGLESLGAIGAAGVTWNRYKDAGKSIKRTFTRYANKKASIKGMLGRLEAKAKKMNSTVKGMETRVKSAGKKASSRARSSLKAAKVEASKISATVEALKNRPKPTGFKSLAKQVAFAGKQAGRIAKLNRGKLLTAAGAAAVGAASAHQAKQHIDATVFHLKNATKKVLRRKD